MGKPFSGLLRFVRLVLFLTGFLVALVTFTPLTWWWTNALMGPWSDARGDTLIVLTGSMLEDNLIGDTSYWRGIYTIRTWREGGWQRILFSGGGGGPTPAAESMKILAESGGVPGSVIQIEGASSSTRESALNVTRLLAGNQDRKVLLTSDYHTFRSVRAFRKAGLTLETRPIPDGRKRYQTLTQRWGVFQDLLVETAKIGYYWLRGWI
jgi:uncharacterized SAM-binding protein YcdF (DUF218 family)